MSVTTETAYPTAAQVMNRARAIVNDAYRGGAGRILTNTAPFTPEYLNGALEELQDKLGNNGVISLIKDNVILGPLTALSQPDPAVQTKITYTGYFDGAAMVTLPKLPSDLRAPLKLWERQVGSGLPFVPMRQPMEGLPSVFQGQWLGQWEWREDALCFMGSTINEEVRVRYEMRQAMISAETPENEWGDVEIQILSSINALATLVAYQYARARGAVALPILAVDADKMMRYIVRRYVRQAQSIDYRRQPYSSGGNTGNGNWGTNLPF